MELRAPSFLATLFMTGLTVSATAGPQPTPEARVRAFIADYSRVHGESTRIIAAGNFDAWKKVIDRLDAAHFVSGAHSGLGQVMSGNAEHDSQETIIRNERHGADALIETHSTGRGLPRWFEYELRETNGDWRIMSLREYLHAVDEPFLSDQERAAFEHPRARPLRALPRNEAALDGDAMFVRGRIAHVGEDSSAIEVRTLGKLHVTSGVLAVGDLGYDAATLLPLSLRVPPGDHPVEVAIAFGRFAALRVRVADAPVASWHPADGSEPGHVVGVDAANVAICDVAALTHVTARRKDKQFEKFAALKGLTAATLLSLTKPDDCAIATSGYGDGAYPVYWGVDAGGKPALLLVNLLVLTVLPDDEDGE